VPVQPTACPQPSGALLPLENISTSVYEDLRRCPYRFFALRQLGLRGADELDAEVDKRDFGNWLHAVLGHFHEALIETPTQGAQERLALIEAAAQRATREMALSDAEFLPFAAAWPAVRDGYLGWLAGHEANGAVFVEAEPWKEQALGNLRLIGRLDRIDRMPDGQAFVIDYKTESSSVTKERVKDPTEDTQLAFYAALVADDTLRAAYVNVGEKSSGTQTVEQPAVVEARDALVAGIIEDFTRIAQGTALPPLGEGAVCDYCAARGLCRKDFWELSK
jgi:ATP-dependent helicase/nuclease subunit B